MLQVHRPTAFTNGVLHEADPSVLAPRPHLFRSREGVHLALSPSRATALLSYARDLGATGYLGARLTRCQRCSEQRIARVLRRLTQAAARSSRYTDTGPYTLMETGLPGVRLWTRRRADGTYVVLGAQRGKERRRPPAYLNEIDLRELEAEIQLVLPLKAHIKWSSLLRPDDLKRLGGGRRHFVYIALDEKEQPLKVGETMNMAGRYPESALKRLGIRGFYVGEMFDERNQRLLGPYVRDAERLVTRKLARMGIVLPKAIHKRPNPDDPIVTTSGGRIAIDSSVPEPLRAAHVGNVNGRSGALTRAHGEEARHTAAQVHGRKAWEIAVARPDW